MFNRLWEPLTRYLILETESLTSKARFRRFRLTLLIMFTTLSIAPLSITSILSYTHYRDLLESKAYTNLELNIVSTKKKVEASVNELLSVMGFILLEHSYEEFSNQKNLDKLFLQLRSQYKDVVDLGVIDSSGKQVAYAGPYDLLGKDFSENPCFIGANEDLVYISTVFMGYRKMPHFVIAIRKNLPGKKDYWMLRATIDAESLKSFISTARAQQSDDIFLIDEDGFLQLTSRFYGTIMDHYPIPEKDDGWQVLVLRNEESYSQKRNEALAYIEGTPWILVLAQQHALDSKTWKEFKNQLIMIFILSTVGVLLIIFRTVGFLGRRVREADQRREDIMAKAEHSNKLASIGRLAAGVAHEINNPLAIIGQKAGLMQDIFEMSGDFENKSKLEEQISGIRESVDRGTIITHRLLGFARRMDISAEKVTINNIVRESISFLEREAEHHHIEISKDLQKELPQILSDRGKLQQIILNIINNAIDAFEDREDGLIRVATSLTENEEGEAEGIKVVIEDNGPGMPPDVLKNIFEPFFTTKETGKGTGLGLSITYGLIKELGGEIDVKSTLGQGTSFTVNLPLKHDEAVGEGNQND